MHIKAWYPATSKVQHTPPKRRQYILFHTVTLP